MSKISIIVPVYNVENYLSNCIDSILNQTFKDFELILVNDGSTDKSLEICERYKNIDSRIKIINKKNEGASAARNAGLDIAKGEYIGFIDSDDYIHPRMYELLYDNLLKYDADIITCDFEEVDNFDEKLLDFKDTKNSEIVIWDKIECLESLDGKSGVKFVVVWNKLYKRKIFDNLRFKLGIIYEDEYIAHRLIYKANKVIYLKEKLYYYLQRKNSVMGSRNEINKIDYLFAISDRISLFDTIPKLKNLQNKYEKFFIWSIFNFQSNINSGYNYKKKLFSIRKEFFKKIKILKKNNNYSNKEIIAWYIFCISPKLYNILLKK